MVEKTEKPKVVGEGTYGCVVKPSLKCVEKDKYSYKNRVSKIMRTDDAIEEKNEMVDLVKIPGIEKYIIRMPEICKPDVNAEFLSVAGTCENRRVKGEISKIKRNRQFGLRLLLLDDGGVNLHDFATQVSPTLSEKDIKIFLTSFIHLFEGIELLRNHDIVHYDLKSQNVVYNIETGSIRIIDFGMIRKKSEFIREGKQGRNVNAKSWNYYPPENSCANRIQYDFEKCSAYRKDFLNFDEFIDKAVNTFDTYCMTYALKKLMPKLYQNCKHVSSGFATESMNLFELYCLKNVFYRRGDLQRFIKTYKSILEKHGMYYVGKPDPSKESQELAHRLSIANLSEKEKTKMAKPRGTHHIIPKMLKPCPPGKERNPITRRCVTVKKTAGPKPCPPGKERNPASGRCVTVKKKAGSKPCPPGKERNPASGRCVTVKKKAGTKPCPPGKERNPASGRCVTIKKKPACKDGKVRNEKGRCVKVKDKRPTNVPTNVPTSVRKLSIIDLVTPSVSTPMSTL